MSNFQNFGHKTKEIVLNNFGIENTTIFNIEILYCILVFFSSPIGLFPIYHIVYENKKIAKCLKSVQVMFNIQIHRYIYIYIYRYISPNIEVYNF